MRRMCPAVPSPRRSPQPADFFNPSGCGTRNEKIERSAAAFSGVVSHNVNECPSIFIFCDDPLKPRGNPPGEFESEWTIPSDLSDHLRPRKKTAFRAHEI